MVVFVVERDLDYDGRNYEGVFSTFEKALNYVNEDMPRSEEGPLQIIDDPRDKQVWIQDIRHRTYGYWIYEEEVDAT